MMLVLMGLIGIAALDTMTKDRQVAGFQNRARLAFYAADAGVATGLNLVLGVASALRRLRSPPPRSGMLSFTRLGNRPSRATRWLRIRSSTARTAALCKG